MPEESINIFISNIYTAAIFTGVFIILFMLLFFLSRIFVLRSKKHEKHFKPAGDSRLGLTSSLLSLNKDINLLKNLFVAGLIFVLSIFFIILILLSYYLANNFKIDSSLYMIIVIIFLILAIAVYVVKSRLTER
jgi:hypothetical protein